MSVLAKIILSIPSLIGIIYMLSFWSIDFFKWISNKIVSYEYQTPIINGLVLLQIGYLIYRLWTYKNLPKSKKTNWTVLLVIFNVVSSLIFIWKKDREFGIENKNTVPNTVSYEKP
ncbi:hypothetical protein [Flagellimonas lutaonensis]|uniref:Uncharacterized protein n=1 Tax=Flagellimonas lutaonensis TaxID=516051 RepID=A0A0D5YPH1_9FLAO|nr:hypothetical protein [Allomuricauda lutaonensis]AKA33839.1 hypothetical protein VC82_147 [Allomuricauda lutaonensis]